MIIDGATEREMTLIDMIIKSFEDTLYCEGIYPERGEDIISFIENEYNINWDERARLLGVYE